MDHAMESILSAVLVFVDVSPHASASRFEFLESHCESSWSKPLSVELGVCVCFEDKLARCVKFPCDEELLLARFRSNLRCCEIAGRLTSKLSQMSVADNCPLVARSSMMPRLVGSASALNSSCVSVALSRCMLDIRLAVA